MLKANIVISLFLYSLLTPLVDLAGQSLKDTYSHALANFVEGYYQECIPGFTRAMFFAEKSGEIYKNANFYLGMAHYHDGNFEQSLKHLKTAQHLYLSDSLKNEIALSIAATYLQKREPKFALANLLQIASEVNQREYLERKIAFYLSLGYFLNHDFEKSKNTLHGVDTGFYKIHEENIEKIYKKSARYAGMTPRLISYLSVVPGLGQLYVGEYGEAANSLLLNSSIYFLYILTIQQLSLLDAIVSVFPWFHRYYVGGIMKTQNMAENAVQKNIFEGYNTLVKMYSE